MRNPSAAVEQHLRKMGLVCSAILSGVVVFSAVVWYLVNRGGFTSPEGLPNYLATLFNLVAFVALLKAHFLPRLFPPPPAGASEEALLTRHGRNTILGFALREGAGFIALVGVLLTGRQAGGFALAGLAIIAMVFAWPRLDQLEG
jgi:hypothetical protein